MVEGVHSRKQQLEKKRKNLKNTKEKVIEFEGRMNMEIKYKRNQMEQKRKTSEGKELLGKFTTKMLYGWDDGKFE